MDQPIAEMPAPTFLTDLRALTEDMGPDGPHRLRIGTDRLIIAAIGRVEPSPGARTAAAEAARACRALAMDLQQSEQLHNAAASDALEDARVAALAAIEQFEAELSRCSLPVIDGKMRRRASPRSSSVVMKKRRPMFATREPAKAEA